VPDGIELRAVRRALVVKLRHHGDVLLASPLFTVLKNHAPHVETDALVYAETQEMLSGHPAIERIFAVDRGWRDSGWLNQLRHEWKLFRALRRRRYDLVIHLTDHPRGSWLARTLGARYSVVRDYRPRRGRLFHGAFTHRYRVPARPRHTVEAHLDALRRLGIQPSAEERRLVLIPGRPAEDAADDLLHQNGLAPNGYICIHPTSRWMFKCWPAERVAELIERLQGAGRRIVLTAAPTEVELRYVNRVKALLRQPVVDLSGKLTLKQLAAIIARAKCFVGVDSAPMHMAAAMQTRCVALFGPSGEEEWGPWMTDSRVVTSPFGCRPCGLDGCGQGKVSECLTAIPVEDVLRAVEALVCDEPRPLVRTGSVA
jgi:heptosyltransferase-3